MLNSTHGLDEGKNFALGAGYGNYGEGKAFGVGATVRVTENLTTTFNVGRTSGEDEDETGYGVGMSYQW